MLEAVKRCWASLWTARAIAYRLKHELDQTQLAMAVVVQTLVDADAAGIIFTANPASGKRDELLISAAWGLGEAVVSGVVTPDTLVVSRTSGRVLRRETAEKSRMTIRALRGTRTVPVPTSLRQQPVLSDAQAAELARLGMRIEALYQTPMDIEWAMEGGRFFILQARAITALPPVWRRPEATALYARSSMAEHTPSPVSPLFATLGLQLANRATVRLWKRITGKSMETLVPAGGIYCTINGYVYAGIYLNWRSLLSMLRLSVAQLGPMFRGSVPRWQVARRELASVVSTWERKALASIGPSELLDGVRVVFGATCRYFTQIQTTLPAASSSEWLFSTLYRLLIRRKHDPPASMFLLGFNTMALQAEQSLFDSAEWVRANQPMAAYIARTPSTQLASDVERDAAPVGLPLDIWSSWRQHFSQHLERFGRTCYEFDFAIPTPQETPGPMLESIKAFLSKSASSPYERQREAAERREQATHAVLGQIGWPRRGWFLRLLRWAQETGPMREDSIFDMGMGHPVIRRMLAELGRRLDCNGAIEQPEDIYWLEAAELESLVHKLTQDAALPSLGERVMVRRHQWQASLRLSPPVLLPETALISHLIHGREARRQAGKVVLQGISTSGGLVTAPACIVLGPEDFSKLHPGDVLVAVTTTPAWTPLFTRAAAIVTDIGGPLSHSSIVAREYGVPAVMATREATRTIQPGQLITVDGNRGRVILGGEPIRSAISLQQKNGGTP